MKNVLLILSTSRTSEEAIEFAVGAAKERGGTLVALYLLETGLAEEVFDRFSDVGFIGDRPSTELSEAIMKEYRQRGYEELGLVQVRAMEEGVEFDPIMEEGEVVSRALDIMEGREVALAVCVRRKQSTFARYFSGSLTDELKEKAPCEVVVIEE
ncbi:MAG: universal stress protein [Thermodesulfobacteriota bacterium]